MVLRSAWPNWKKKLRVSEPKTGSPPTQGEAPYFLVLALRHRDKKLVQEKLLPNPHKTVQTGKGIRVSEWLISQGVDEVIAAKSFDHKGPYYVFADAGVAMQQTGQRDIGQIKTDVVAKEEETETGPKA